jgi:hypothetical protein|nr:MAG TPA: nucleotidyltransferase [Caudoviricetes sp.]
MNEYYKNVVKLLIDFLSSIFVDDMFALKGGTAINLFHQNLPRFSVDVDLAYTNRHDDRVTALSKISAKLAEISKRLKDRGIDTDRSRFDNDSTKLIISRNGYSVKIEVNHVFRGTLNPPVKLGLTQKAEDVFMSEGEALVMDKDELHAGKLVAALDRQHPRDLFDVKKLYEIGGITDGIISNFVCYLCGGNGVFCETLNPNLKDIREIYEKDFVGMSFEETSVEILTEVARKMKSDILKKLKDEHKKFLISFAKAEPDFSIAPFPYLNEYPAIQWKLMNLKKFKAKSPNEFNHQILRFEKLFQ